MLKLNKVNNLNFKILINIKSPIKMKYLNKSKEKILKKI